QPESVLADELDALRLGALRTLGCLELHLRVLREGLVALAEDRAVVNEQVLAAFIRGDESVPLVGVEPLDGSGCHRKNTSSTAQERAEEARRAHPVLAQVVRTGYQPESRPSVAAAAIGRVVDLPSAARARGRGREQPQPLVAVRTAPAAGVSLPE